MNLGELFSNLTTGDGVLRPMTEAPQAFSDVKQAMDQTLMELVELQPGESFRGEVLDVNREGVTIRSADMSFQAKFSEPVELHIGDQLSFVVRENKEGLLTIAPVRDSVILGEEGLIYKALKEAGLAPTDRNLDAAESLLKNGQAMDREGILGLAKESLKYPDVPVSHLAWMEKNGLALTPENVKNFENYAGWNSRTSEQLDIIKQQFPKLLEQIFSEEGEKAFTEGSLPPRLTALREFSAEMLSGLPKEEMTEKQPFVMIQRMLEQAEKADGGEWLEKLSDYVRTHTDSIQNALADQLSIRPQELFTQKLSRFYGKLDTLMERLRSLSEPAKAQTAAAPLYEAAGQVQGELAFLGEMNQGRQGEKAAQKMMLMLPVKLQNQVRQGNLYIYSNKRGSGERRDGIRLFLHLDMEWLGALEVMMELKQRNVLMSFSLEEEAAVQLLREHLPELTRSLEKKGYRLSGSVGKKEKDRDFEKDFLRTGEDAKNLLRYSFDMRV